MEVAIPASDGAPGFCFGGGYALTAGAGWAVVSTNYGVVPGKTALEGIGAVIGCYGTRDASMRSSPEKLQRRLAAVGHDPAEIHFFDAGHSFLTDAEMGFWKRRIPGMAFGDYREAREDGWRRIFAFFDRHLG